MSNPENMTPSKERRKWLKFVAAHGMYEKSVRVCKEMSAYEYYHELEPRGVIDAPTELRKGTISVNGFFRVRTDREYYPVCGKYGIPDDERSGLAKEFAAHRLAGDERGRRKLWAEKMADDEKKRRIKAAENHRMARNIPRCELAARLGIPVSMASDEILEAKRNQIATLRTIKQIRKQIDENTND